jgi:hypothetical protein
VSIARFFDAATNKGAYVVWKTTADGSSLSGFALPVGASVSSATLVALTAGSTTGTAAAASIAAGHLTLTVTETPTLVLVDGAP